MGYQPFLIAPFGTGLDIDIDPWMAPPDAFTEIINGHIKHGVTEKRNGYRLLAEMVHSDDNFAVSAATNASPVVLTVTSKTGAAVTITDGMRIQINYAGGMSELNGNTYLASNVTATTIDLQDLQGVDVDGSAFGAYTTGAQVSYYPGLRIMGLHRYIASDNSKNLIAFDTRRAAIYNKTNDSFEPLSATTTAPATYADIFNSGDEDFVWATNWASVASSVATPLFNMYFTNGLVYAAGPPEVNGIWRYNASAPTTVTLFRPQINSTTYINGCKLLYTNNQRLMLMSTFEGANVYPQRKRWCQAQDPSLATAWDDNTPGKGGYVDAPTGDHIISGQFLQNSIIVYFTNSVWTSRITADPALPFRWDKINNFRACDARMSSVEYDRYVLALGQRGITATDGVETQRVDERIEDFVKRRVNSNEFKKINGLRSYEETRTWILYPEDENDDCTTALIFDDDSKAFSTYKFSRQVSGSIVDLNVLGYGGIEKDYLLSDFPNSIHSNRYDLPVTLQGENGANEETISSYFWQDDADIFLGGCRDGQVQILEVAGDDGGNQIEFVLESAAWNPFKDKGIECQLGYIDFYVESHSYTRATVSFYKNNSEDPYATRYIDFLPNLRETSAIIFARVLDDPTLGVTVTSPQHSLTTGEERYIYGIEGAEYINGGPYTVTVIDKNTFTFSADMTSSGSAMQITGIGLNNPMDITVDSNNFNDGDEIYFVDVGGTTELNFVSSNYYTVTNSTDTTFQLDGIDGTSGFTAWTSGGYAFRRYSTFGVVTQLPFIEQKAWKRAYAGGIGYWHKIKIESEGIDRPVRILAYMPYFRPRGKRVIN